VTEHH